MLSFPLKTVPTGVEGSWDSEEVVDGLRKLLSSQYGDAAARGLAGDLGVLRRARTDALLAAVGSAAEAAAAEDVLVRYCRLLQLLEKALGSDVRESRACRFEWRSCWEEKERRAHAAACAAGGARPRHRLWHAEKASRYR